MQQCRAAAYISFWMKLEEVEGICNRDPDWPCAIWHEVGATTASSQQPEGLLQLDIGLDSVPGWDSEGRARQSWACSKLVGVGCAQIPS